jgi:hypothetical protein
MTQTQGLTRFELRMLRGSKTLALWTGAWLLALVLLGEGPDWLWTGLGLTVAAAAISLGTGIGLGLAWRKHLAEQDDLHRKVLMDAMGIALGVGMIVSLPYTLLERHDVAPFDAHSGHLVILQSLAFMASLITGLRRYR